MDADLEKCLHYKTLAAELYNELLKVDPLVAEEFLKDAKKTVGSNNSVEISLDAAETIRVCDIDSMLRWARVGRYEYWQKIWYTKVDGSVDTDDLHRYSNMEEDFRYRVGVPYRKVQ